VFKACVKVKQVASIIVLQMTNRKNILSQKTKANFNVRRKTSQARRNDNVKNVWLAPPSCDHGSVSSTSCLTDLSFCIQTGIRLILSRFEHSSEKMGLSVSDSFTALLSQKKDVAPPTPVVPLLQ
jgi:hypothetical protein